MSQIEAAVRSIAPYLKPGAVVVNKSTVPVGSGNWVRTLIEEALPDIDAFEFHVVSNPEFLRKLRESMKGRLILDGRGVIAEAVAAEAGLTIKGFSW